MSAAPAAVENWFPAEEFRARRERVLDALGPGASALVQGSGPVRGFEVFRQTNELFYLTGLEFPQAYLLLDGRSRASTLFLPPPDSHAAGEGPGAEQGPETVRAAAGVDAVR